MTPQFSRLNKSRVLSVHMNKCLKPGFSDTFYGPYMPKSWLEYTGLLHCRYFTSTLCAVGNGCIFLPVKCSISSNPLKLESLRSSTDVAIIISILLW